MTSEPKGRESLPLNDKAKGLIDNLPADEQDRIDSLISTAANNQRDALEEAMDGALKLVPGPLRKQIRKALLR